MVHNPYREKLRKMSKIADEIISAELGKGSNPPSPPYTEANNWFRPLDPFSAYVIFCIFLSGLALLCVPGFSLILNGLIAGYVDLEQTVLPSFSILFGLLIFWGLSKLEGSVGAWKWKLPWEKQSISNLRIAGFQFFPAPLRCT